MRTCRKVIKLAIEKGGAAGARAGQLQDAIDEHLGACASCAALWTELRNPVPDPYQSPRQRSRTAHASEQGGVAAATVAPPEAETWRSAMTTVQGHETTTGGKFFTVFIDDREYHVETPELTGGQIMDLAGIPRDVGLILVLEDGTQVQVGVDETIELKPGRRFKKAPRFVRG